jgi:hypothetical protein
MKKASYLLNKQKAKQINIKNKNKQQKKMLEHGASGAESLLCIADYAASCTAGGLSLQDAISFLLLRREIILNEESLVSLKM